MSLQGVLQTLPPRAGSLVAARMALPDLISMNATRAATLETGEGDFAIATEFPDFADFKATYPRPRRHLLTKHAISRRRQLDGISTSKNPISRRRQLHGIIPKSGSSGPAAGAPWIFRRAGCGPAAGWRADIHAVAAASPATPSAEDRHGISRQPPPRFRDVFTHLGVAEADRDQCVAFASAYDAKAHPEQGAHHAHDSRDDALRRDLADFLERDPWYQRTIGPYAAALRPA